ncbi:hypothetical protein [Algoriphagus marinus]|uniref:hypothetical protein n=1 Tax=Algoriphagus marinus TaxID=1925762 RepID=UPI00094B82F3|nr:hypothetical protein [Algoriphagus marinus]
MNISSKFQLKINEFCQNGNLEEFRQVLILIFEKIENENCSISARYDRGASVHEFQNSNGECKIRIPIMNYCDNPIEAIWVILHEFGHHMSGAISLSDFRKAGNEFILDRELKAWDYARNELIKIPELLSRIKDFDSFAGKCIASYERNL